MFTTPAYCSNNNNDEIFTSKIYHHTVEPISPNFEVQINFRTNGVQAKKMCLITGEKIDQKGLVQLRVCEKNDHTKMYISTIDLTSFNELKQDQCLHVTFPGFVDNLIKILSDCQKGNLQISLMSSAGSGQEGEFVMQFYEQRSFKNLVHLYLPVKTAPFNVIIYYMNSVMESMRAKTASMENTLQGMQHELNKNGKTISQLERDNSKIREDALEHERISSKRHQDELHKLKDHLKNVNELREADNEHNKQTIAMLQSKMDRLAKDNFALQAEKSQEVKNAESLKEEICLLKASVANMKEQNEKLHGEISALKNLERKNDMYMMDSKKQIQELQDKIKRYDKLKSELIAELEAEKKICQTKRSALEMATDEISKANEIISKQSQEILKHKQTIGWRTEVALQQEKAIKEKEKTIAAKNQQIQSLQSQMGNMQSDVPQQLEAMKKLADAIEYKYSEKIRDLHRRLTIGSGKENSLRLKR